MPLKRTYLCCAAQIWLCATRARKDMMMSNRKIFSAIGDFFTVFGSAVAASRAVEAGRKPRANDLRNLGVEPAAFDRIGRRF
ncbi:MULTISPECIES: hypothetical protein [Mesorhizobium]|uniref:hypothetical protein n=1 Tax=Mesorhizobium TaxID=68287 RepID=UPI00145A0164|nr:MULTISPECIES: hypothetical protein [Mesorhizobium]